VNLVDQPWNIVFLVGFFLYMGIRYVYQKRTSTEEKVHRQVDGAEKTILPFVLIGGLLIPFLYLLTPLLDRANYRLPDYLPYVGSVVMLIALWLFWRSHADLGANWSISLELRKGHRLVDHGVYRRVRHPMYAAIWLWNIAQVLLLQNWLAGWSALVSFAVLYAVRTPREEQMMCEAFGDEYRTYMKRTGRLFPRLGSRL